MTKDELPHFTFTSLAAATASVVTSLERRKLAVNAFDFFAVNSVRFGGCWIGAKMNLLAAQRDPCAESFSALADDNALEAGLVWRPRLSVGQVLKWLGLPQIDNAIVRGIAVNVVDLVDGPFAIVVEPCETMSQVVAAIQPDVDPADLVWIAGNLPAQLRTESWSDPPGEDACVWIVAQGVPQFGN